MRDDSENEADVDEGDPVPSSNVGTKPEDDQRPACGPNAADTDGLGISRRAVLSGLAAVGLVGSLTSLGTRMTLSDTTQFRNNSLEADDLDLGIAWTEFYNGEEVEATGICGATDRDGYVDNSAPAVDLSGVEPGDSGELDVCLWAPEDVGALWMRLQVTSVAENGVTELEAEAGDDVESSVGELHEHLQVRVGVDSDCDRAREGDPLASGTIADVGSGRLGTGIQLDPATPLCLVLEWSLPDTDALPATVLTDAVQFSVEFTAEQSGYTEPTNPWANL